MRNRIKTAVLSIAAALLTILPGCGKRIDMELPEKPIEFHTGTFVNPADPDGTYQSIEYKTGGPISGTESSRARSVATTSGNAWDTSSRTASS